MDAFWIILLAIIFAALAFDLMILEPRRNGYGPFYTRKRKNGMKLEPSVSPTYQGKDFKTHLPPGPISIRIACRSSQRKRREKERRMRG